MKKKHGRSQLLDPIDFAREHPQVGSVTVEITEKFGPTNYHATKSWRYSEANLPYRIPCSECGVAGGFNMKGIISVSVSKRKNAVECTEACSNMRMHPKGQLSCTHTFDLKISIEYSENQDLEQACRR